MVNEVSSYIPVVAAVPSPGAGDARKATNTEVKPVSAREPLQTDKRAEQQGRPVSAAAAPQVSKDEEEVNVLAVVKEMKDYVQNIERNLEFSVDEESGRTIITVTDPETDEIIRQIPPEDLLYMVKALQENSASLFVEAKV